MAERPTYDLIAQNRRRTWVLMFSFFVLLALVGIAVSIIVGGGLIGVMFAVTLSFGISFSSYFSSASIALTATRRSRPPERNSGACTIWSRRSRSLRRPQAGCLRRPRPLPQRLRHRPRRQRRGAVTTGLMDKMNRAELEGDRPSSAHPQWRHLGMTVAVATVGAIAMISTSFSDALLGGFTGGGASPKPQQQQRQQRRHVADRPARSSSLRFSPRSNPAQGRRIAQPRVAR